MIQQGRVEPEHQEFEAVIPTLPGPEDGDELSERFLAGRDLMRSRLRRAAIANEYRSQCRMVMKSTLMKIPQKARACCFYRINTFTRVISTSAAACFRY